MKNESYNNLKKSLVAIVILLLFANVIYSQEKSYQQFEQKNNFIKNLVFGINSDNTGLKRSCIYLAGKHEVSEVVPELIKQFKESENPEIRFLAALVLYKIGDRKALSIIKAAAKNENNPKVKNLCLAITLAQDDDVMLTKR